MITIADLIYFNICLQKKNKKSRYELLYIQCFNQHKFTFLYEYSQALKSSLITEEMISICT